MGWVKAFFELSLLATITLCSVAFICFEYRPSITEQSVSYSTPDNRALSDPKCSSKIYTDKYKRKFLDCAK